MSKIIYLLSFVVILIPSQAHARSLEAQARVKIQTLNALIVTAENAGIDTLKEKMSVRTAEVFLDYADWDEAHKSINADYFRQVSAYKNTADQTAAELPDFERSEVILLLDEAIDYLTQLINGEVFRRPIPNLDWARVTHDGDQLTFNNQPVFLADYTWKPDIDRLTEYHGNLDGFFLMSPYVVNQYGAIKSNIVGELRDKPNGRIGFIFLNHKNTPQWARTKYGPGFAMREDTYTAYDIDNPGARELYSMLFKGTVPKMAGKKYTKLGYMLCNEPHFYTTERVWATGPVSEYTKDKFRVWLQQRHRSISRLNGLWKANFTDFDDITITIPISQNLQGTAKWYDWVSFNMDRVTDWYRFLKNEIRKYDPVAKVHLKIMPSLWTGNKRNHGIDFEELTRFSEIIGNDAGAPSALMWGHEEWQDRYAFEWKEICMAQDFQTSVSPEKIMFNSESHFLSTGRSRDLYQKSDIARATFWLAHMHGLNASQIWFWARKADGSIKNNAGKGYGGSNNQQPRIVNEVASTFMDLNSFAEEIMTMQRQRKALRLFYSQTSAINKDDHMDDVFELYEALNFEGLSLGFATRDILAEQDPNNWDVILVRKTEYVTQAELSALQAYLDQGGTVLLDDVSLKLNEYGQTHRSFLRAGNGTILRTTSLGQMVDKAMAILTERNKLPEVRVTETNNMDHKGCQWKCFKNADGNHILSVVNLGKGNATLSIELTSPNYTGTRCMDLFNGITVSSNPTLKPNEVFFVEVTGHRRR